ncbi:ribosome silencing factor [Mumia sp. zg.B21]|uniref:ribosome silencing factor n=1 Tax=Mumia sp. zg.B21 TaxID=2855447 RepID=UPI001C6F36EF|nr:ribosome silencing factor [Mumia sp. zg.B21]MBW9211195.1 ribosome silencing factor [Mumia sp. zg.B21]
MTASERALELTHAAAAAAADKLAHEIIAYDVSEQLVITDVFVLASAGNDRQVRAISDAVQEKLLEHGAKVVRREGEREGRWVLLDYAEIVVHVQHDEDRSFYALERLWGDCPAVALPEIGEAAGRVPSAPTSRESIEQDEVPLAGEPPVADA